MTRLVKTSVESFSLVPYNLRVSKAYWLVALFCAPLLMGGACEKFVEVGAFGEKFLIDVCLKHFPKVFAQPFNAYDLLRQFFDGTVDVENGRQAMR